MTELEKYLDSQDFYEDCQAYRHAPDDGRASKAWQDLRSRIQGLANGETFVSEYE
jgi:hypothetical protein